MTEVNDAQYNAISADGETKKRVHVGRTGGLPHVGKAWYRLLFELTEDEARKTARTVRPHANHCSFAPAVQTASRTRRSLDI